PLYPYYAIVRSIGVVCMDRSTAGVFDTPLPTLINIWLKIGNPPIILVYPLIPLILVHAQILVYPPIPYPERSRWASWFTPPNLTQKSRPFRPAIISKV